MVGSASTSRTRTASPARSAPVHRASTGGSRDEHLAGLAVSPSDARSTTASNTAPTRVASSAASVRSTHARSTCPATASDAAIVAGSAGRAARSHSGTRRTGGHGEAHLGAEPVDEPPQRRGDVRVWRADPAVAGVGGRRRPAARSNAV